MFLATLHQRWSLTRLQRPQSPSHGHRQRTAVWFVVFWGDMLENPKRQICWCWLQTHSPILDLYEYNKEYMSSIYKTRAWPAPWQERRPAASKEGFLSDNMGFASHQQGDAKCQNGDFMVYGSNGFYAQNWSLTWEPFGSSWSDLLIVFLKCWCVMILEPQRRRLIFSGCWWRWHQIKFSKHLQSLAIVQTSFLPLCWGHSEGEEDVHLSPEEKEKQRQGLRLPRTQHAQWLDPEAATTRSRGCATSQTSDSCEPSNGGPHRIVWRDAQEHPGCFLVIWCWEISLGVYHWSLWRFDEICRVYCRVIVLADSCLILVPFFPDFAMWRWLLLVAWPQPWLCCLKGGVPHWLVRNLKSMGFSQPTPIQMQCVPAILSGNHVLASAPTGRWQLTFWNIGNVVCHAHTQIYIYIYVYYTDTDTYIHIYIYLHIIYTHIYIYIYTCWFYPWAMGTSQVSLGFPHGMAPWFPPTCPSLGGSGKTIAFLGPILATLGKPGKDFARCLIVDPSRELAPHGLRSDDDDDDDDHDEHDDHDDHVGFMNPWHPWSILSVGTCCMCSSEDVSSMLCSIVSDRLRTHRPFADSEDIRRYCRLMQVSCDYRCPWLSNLFNIEHVIQPLRAAGMFHYDSLPIGSMYAIYGNIYHQYAPNVTIYTIHGSYGLCVSCPLIFGHVRPLRLTLRAGLGTCC